MDKKLASDMVRKSKKEFKVRRNQLQTQRLSKNTKREAKELKDKHIKQELA
jgi:hypothetical protein